MRWWWLGFDELFGALGKRGRVGIDRSDQLWIAGELAKASRFGFLCLRGAYLLRGRIGAVFAVSVNWDAFLDTCGFLKRGAAGCAYEA